MPRERLPLRDRPVAMGRRSAAGAGAAAQAEASVTMGKEEPKRKRSAIYVRKTLVKPQSPKEKDTSKLPPSPPLMSKARAKNPPPKATMSPPRIRDGRVVSPSPMSKPRLNNHYMPPKYHSPPRSRMRGVSPPPPVGIRGRVARGLSPNMSSPSPPPYEEELPHVLPPSPVSTAKIRRQVSPSRLPPVSRSRRHASPGPPRSPSPTPRGRGGRRNSPPRPPISPSPRSRSRVGRASSPPRLPPTPTPRGAARRRSPSPQSPPTLPKNACLSRKDPAIREITPCLLEEPIPSPIYERLSPLNTNKRHRSPSPSYLQGNLSAKPPLPPQALSSRRPRSPTPVEQRILGPLPTNRSTSPRLKRRFSCVTVLSQDPIFGDLKPTLPPPPPTAPSNFRRITPNFATRRSRKASFVILNETTVKRKMGSRRASVDGTVDAEGKVKVGPRSMSEEGPAKEGEEGKTKEDGEKKGKGKNGNGKNGSGKNGSKKPVYILLPDEEQPAEGENGDEKKGKENGNGKKGDKTKEGKDASGDTPGTSAAVASSEVLATAGGVAVGTPVPGGSTTGVPSADASGEAKADGATPSGEQTAEAAATAAATVTATPAVPGAVAAATQGEEGAKAGTPTQEEMMSKVVKGEVDVESMEPNQMAPSMQEGAGGIRDQKQILEAGALSSRGSIASTMASGMKDDIVSLQMGSGEEGVSGSIHGAPSDEAGSVDAFPGSGKESSSKEGSVRRQCSSEVTDQDGRDLETGIAPYIVIDVSSPVHRETTVTDSSPTPSPPPSPLPTGAEAQDTSEIDSEDIGKKSSLQAPSKGSSKASSAKSFKPVEYGVPSVSGQQDQFTPRCPCCPAIALPSFLHAPTKLLCPQVTRKSLVTGPNPNYLGKFAVPPSPVHEKATGCTAKWYSLLERMGCKSKKTGRFWWQNIYRGKKKSVAPVSVIGGPMALSNKPSWTKNPENVHERASGLTRWLRRTICKSCYKPDEELGVKAPGMCKVCCTTCCRKVFFCKFFEKCICCKPDNAVADAAAIAAMESVAAKWNAVADTKAGKDGKKRGSMDPVSEKPKLDPTLVEHNSLIRAAIPILPVPLAWLCLLANTVAPGTGTLSSGIFCLCLGKARFSMYDSPEGRFGSFCLNILVAIFQVFTVIFCLVGWGWSLWWGVIMVRVARKHKKLKARALEEGSSANTASTSKDDNS